MKNATRDRRSTVESAEIRLAVREWGDRVHPTVVLVHGYPDNSDVWLPVAERLRARFHVVAYDVRGAGASSAPASKRDYRLEQLAADGAAVIEATAPGKAVHVVGHDWGSIQSWETVTAPRLQGRIASYTSISGPCLDHVGYWMRERLGSGDPRQLAQAANQILHSWYIALFQLPLAGPLAWRLGLDRRWPALLARLEGLASVGVNPTQRDDGRTGVQLYRANFIDRLLHPRERRCDLPVQLIVPLRDPFVSPALFEGIERWVPQLSRTDVDGGHWLPLSAPDLVAEQITAFVERVEGPRTRGASAA
ncbi:alpha/beta fold hydrolase [Fontimonas sp. SYSU GA230001]